MNTNTVMQVLQVLRHHDRDMAMGTVLCFLELMGSESLTVSQAESRLNLSKQSASRALRKLTHRADPKREGLDLAHTAPDPEDYRTMHFMLNERGKALANEIRRVLQARKETDEV